METWTLIADILKTGFFLAGALGVGCLIIWALIRNIKWLFGSGKADKGLVDWLVIGLRQGCDDKDLKIILLEKDYKPKEITKSLKEAYKIMIREVEGKNAEKGRGLGNPEEEIKKLTSKK